MNRTMADKRGPRADSELDQEWLRQNNLTYGALIGVAVVMVQPFLTAASLDTSATISVVAFSVAIPLLAALILINRQESFRRRRARSALVSGAQVVAQLAAFTGLVAGFWHINALAGAVLLAAALLGLVVHSTGYALLEGDDGADSGEDQGPGA